MGARVQALLSGPPDCRRAKILSPTEAGQAKIGGIERKLAARRSDIFMALPEQDPDAASRAFAATGTAS